MNSGGSRISQRELCQPIIFAENCMKMKEIGEVAHGPRTHLDPPMIKGVNTPSGKRQISKMPLDAWVDTWEKSPLTCIGRCR